MSLQPEAHSSIVGSSTAERVLNCPASIKLCWRVPKPKPSVYAEEGSALHLAVAMILNEEVKDDRDIIGMTFKGFTVDHELYDECIAPSLRMLDQLLEEWGDPEFIVERRVNFPGIKGAFGTADFIGRTEHCLFVLDWKFGAGVPVSAFENKQVLFTGGGVMHDLPNWFPDDPDFPIEGVIIQPRVVDEPQRWRTTRRFVSAFVHELQDAVHEGLNEPEPRFREGKWCRWCAAAPVCPHLRNRMDEARGIDGEQLNAQLPDLLKLAHIASQWADDIKSFAHQRADEGAVIPGYKLVQRYKNRQWKNQTKALNWLRKHRITPTQKKSFITVAEAEKKVKKATGLEIPDVLIQRDKNGTALVPSDHPKPAISNLAQSIGDLGRKLAAK